MRWEPVPGAEPNDFRCVAATPVAGKLLGVSVEGLTDQRLRSLFPDAAGNLAGDWQRVWQENSTSRLDLFYHHPQETTGHWLELTAARSDTHLIVTLYDVSDRIASLHTIQDKLETTTQQQQRQHAYQRALLDGAINGIVSHNAIRNAEGKIVDFGFLSLNKAAESLIGRTINELAGHTMLELFPRNRELGLYDMYVQVVETGIANRTEVYYQGDGLDFWIAVSAVKQGDGFVVTFVDVTEARQTRQRLEFMVQQLRRSNDYLQQFAYVASHDLQEPLRKIHAFGDVLQKQFGPMLGEAGSDLIHRMQKASGRMQALVRDLLAYSRLNTQPKAAVAVDLNMLFAEILNDLELAIQEKQARVQVAPLPSVAGSLTQLTQLFVNLLSNALKFHKPDQPPQVTITGKVITGKDLPELKALNPRQRYGCVQVSDEGIGFDEQYSERVFQMFQRLHGVTKYPGTGVGLALCKRIIENHGGWITVRSQPDRGTTFTVYLPVEMNDDLLF
ncbi:hypothetical protein GCM10023189_27070 [Nibrella saemangeumensis]|uniref:histidine kinase n=2 Tax=Nibrella saemangeumensis TaxID=1084526 RepID=A0ABP8MVV5_9BACT